MTGTTHLMMGAVAGTLAVAVVGSNDWPKEVLIGVAAFAATLPDLDTEWSLIPKKFSYGTLIRISDARLFERRESG